MKPSGDYGRYYCFEHGVDFEDRDEAKKHLMQKHEDMTRRRAKAILDQIDEQYENIEDAEDDVL